MHCVVNLQMWKCTWNLIASFAKKYSVISDHTFTIYTACKIGISGTSQTGSLTYVFLYLSSEKSGQLRYSVLWLPSRYTLLYVYVVVLVIATVMVCVNFILSPRKSNYRWQKLLLSWNILCKISTITPFNYYSGPTYLHVGFTKNFTARLTSIVTKMWSV